MTPAELMDRGVVRVIADGLTVAEGTVTATMADSVLVRDHSTGTSAWHLAANAKPAMYTGDAE